MTREEWQGPRLPPPPGAHPLLTPALFRRGGGLGLLGVTVPEEYGGAGLDATAAVQVFEALASSDPGFALAVLAHSVLFAQNVCVNGNESQRKHVLPRAATGEW